MCSEEYGQRVVLVREGTLNREDIMTKSLKVGDEVSWDSSGGHSTGKVVKEQASPTHIKGHKVAASKDNPQYIVKSDKSGKLAAHKPGELKKA